MKRYTSESSHSIGYKWEIDAPEGLTAEDVRSLQRQLCQYTDTPDTAAMIVMLNDDDYCNELDRSKMELFKQVIIYIEEVHREATTQSFREE